VVELSRLPKLKDQSPDDARWKLMGFASQVPDDYALAAREAVNGKAQRDFRGKTIRRILSAHKSHFR
jgi:hypothetical protein